MTEDGYSETKIGVLSLKSVFFKATIFLIAFKEKELPTPSPYTGGWIWFAKDDYY